MENKIKVLIVDDDQSWREALREFLIYDDQLSIAGEAGSMEEAVKWAESKANIDIVLMDIHLSDSMYDGMDTMLEMSKHRDYKFIMLTSLQNKAAVQEAFTIGAINYISKDYVEEIPQAIKDAHANKTSLHHSVSALILSDWVRVSSKITDQEVGILKFLGEGYSFAEISEKLNLEKQSVKNIVGKLSKKLGYVRFDRSIIERVKKFGWFRKG